MSPLTPLSWLEHRQAGHMAVGPLTGWRTRIKFKTEVYHLNVIFQNFRAYDAVYTPSRDGSYFHVRPW